MSNQFTRESDSEGDERQRTAEEAEPAAPAGVKNYITPGGLQRLRDELRFLLTRERRAVTAVVTWAAGNGDRSENADYKEGKRRLREIDRKLRFLQRRLAHAEVVDPAAQTRQDRVFFGATVTYATEDDVQRTVTIVGVDEADMNLGKISVASPVARALLKARAGDEVRLRTPNGWTTLEIVEINYPLPPKPLD